MKYLIIGGGIAGLYSALLLSENKDISTTDIIVLEKSYRWGRRVHTLERDNIKYECGAGRFLKEHKILMSLITRYKLDDKLIKLSKKTQDRQILNNRMMIPTNLDEYYDKLMNLQLNRDDLIGKSVFDVCTEMFGIEIATLLKSSHGYDDDFLVSNAYDGLHLLQTQHKKDFYVMQEGLEQIITHMVRELTDKKVDLRLHNKCMKWDKLENSMFKAYATNFKGETHEIICDKIILALDKWGLCEFKELTTIHHLLDSVNIVPLTRIYARFPIDENTGFAWFHGIPKTTTNLPIRIFIPINEKNGLCMISYSDGHFASEWQREFITGDINSLIMTYIRKMFPEKKIPEAEWIQKLHWAHGVHTWRPLANSNLIYDQIQNPFPNIYICGETYSKNQGWIEGSLETSFEVIQKIIKSKENKVLKYTKSEVSKSNSLTIIENRVYDLAKINWLDKHPGGDIIKKAIGIDSTHMFKYISHPAYVMNILLDLYVGDLELK
jgi:protoporphyrinogen oxidase